MRRRTSRVYVKSNAFISGGTVAGKKFGLDMFALMSVILHSNMPLKAS
jgi:hypothetical protein